MTEPREPERDPSEHAERIDQPEHKDRPLLPYPTRFHDPRLTVARAELYAAYNMLRAAERKYQPTSDEVLLARAHVWQAELTLALRIAELELRRTRL